VDVEYLPQTQRTYLSKNNILVLNKHTGVLPYVHGLW